MSFCEWLYSLRLENVPVNLDICTHSISNVAVARHRA